jgi:hypothetical protein
MSVIDQAANVGGVVSAARQRESWQKQMAKTSDEEKREALHDAIGTLEVRFPEIEDLGPGEAERFARERGHGKGARSPSHEGRTRPAAAKRARSTPAAKPKAKAKPAGAGKTPTPASSQSRGDRRGKTPLEQRARRRGSQAYRETGIPAAGASASRIVMSALGATVGLSALFLLLTSAEKGSSGGQAVVGLLDTATGFLRRIIAPVDFFGPQLTQKDYSLAVNTVGRVAGAGELPKLAPLKNQTPTKPLHIKPSELGFSATPRPRHKRR